MKTEENGNDSIFLCRKGLLSPIKELDEVEVLERHTSVGRDSGSSGAEVAKTVADPTFPGPVVSDDDRKCWDLFQRSHTPPPIWTLSSPQLPALPTSKRRVDIPVTPEREEATYSLLASLDHVSEPHHLASSSRIIDLPLPVFPRISLPRLSLSPSGIDKMLERRLASSARNKNIGSAAPDPLLGGLLSSAQDGEFHSTGNCYSELIWNYLSLTIIFYSSRSLNFTPWWDSIDVTNGGPFLSGSSCAS
jgi:hypothetical protein